MPAPIRRILVPVDFSEHAREALQYALRLAEPLEADVDVLHVFERPYYVGTEHVAVPGQPGHTVAEYLEGQCATELAEFLRTVPEPPGVRIQPRCVDGDPARVLVDESGHYDLVVMGRHGRTGLLHLLMGSVSVKVLQEAHCPVLTVRHREVAAAPLLARTELALG